MCIRDRVAIIGVVALIIIGPKDLPRVLRTLGRWTAKARALTREFRGHVDDMIRESEFDEVKRGLEDTTDGGVRDYVENTIDPNHELRDSFQDSAENFDDEFHEVYDDRSTSSNGVAQEIINSESGEPAELVTDTTIEPVSHEGPAAAAATESEPKP